METEQPFFYVNLERIKDEAITEIAEANNQVEKEIFLARQAENAATTRAAAESRRAYEEKAKKDLPYAK